MSRLNQVLTLLLVLQAALLGVLHLGGEDEVKTERGLLLAGLEVDAVTRLQVKGEGDESVTLDKQADGWVVAEAQGYAADATKVEQALRDLAALEPADVVSTTTHHHRDKKVAADDYRKRAVLTTATGERTLYLGDSGRAGSVFARVGGEDRVVAVRDFSAWRLSERPDSWLDKDYFEVDRDRIARLTLRRDGSAIALQRVGSAWTLEGPDGAVDAKQEAVDKLLNKASKVSLTSVEGRADTVQVAGPGALVVELGLAAESLSPAAGDDDDSAEPAVPAEVTSTRTLSIVPDGQDEDRFLVHADGSDFVVAVRKWTVEDLLSAEAASLSR